MRLRERDRQFHLHSSGERPSHGPDDGVHGSSGAGRSRDDGFMIAAERVRTIATSRRSPHTFGMNEGPTSGVPVSPTGAVPSSRLSYSVDTHQPAEKIDDRRPLRLMTETREQPTHHLTDDKGSGESTQASAHGGALRLECCRLAGDRGSLGEESLDPLVDVSVSHGGPSFGRGVSRPRRPSRAAQPRRHAGRSDR